MLSRGYNMWPMMTSWSNLDGEMDRMFGIVTDRNSGIVTMEPNHRVLTSNEGGTVEVELPGVAKEDIQLEVEHRVLKVTGKRFRRSQAADANGENKSDSKGDSQDDRKPVVVYSLQLRLGRDADTDKMSCESYKDGLMILRLPSLQKEEVRKININ